MTAPEADIVPWWHMFHRWSQWSGGLVTKSGLAIVQKRRCLVCGKEQVRFEP